MSALMTLSPPALDLFRHHIETQGRIDVDDANRLQYRELEQAGLVLLGRPFAGEPRYHLTREGFELRVSLCGDPNGGKLDRPA